MTLREFIEMRILYDNFRIRTIKPNGEENKEYDKSKILNRTVTIEDVLSAKTWDGKETLPEEYLDYHIAAIYGTNNKYKVGIEIRR